MPGYNWMGKYLSDDALLTDIIMPGSHDAGIFSGDTANAGFLGWKGAAICQHTGLGGQLNAGSRFFDLRARLVREANRIGQSTPVSRSVQIKKKNSIENITNGEDVDRGRIRFYHGGKKTGTKGADLDSQLNEVKNFLQQRNTEFCILRFTKSKEVPHAVMNLVSEILGDNNLLYQGTGNLARIRVGDVRGKAIAIFDKDFTGHNQTSGLHHYKKNDACTNGLGVSGSFSGSPWAGKSVSTQQKNLKKYELQSDRLYSWYQTQTYLKNIQSSTQSGVGSRDNVKGLFNNLLNNEMYDSVNIVLMDFVDNFKCRNVYRSNVFTASRRLNRRQILDIVED
ncbi:hypothetical protein [Oceanospirillum sediminis]|uniref:Phosphatidylinositol diacylglycerol-lyase n=1 Tax=Oceanospirillum sediminis TaxID=2760088 RepID=A0A839IQW9_9GAMM|nr:hypothetical protein [Oceanospirillum sediminis]MBB1486616.1 hypothetical protein [Oceanospirillum sediminis]